jgi:hypothetical protein
MPVAWRIVMELASAFQVPEIVTRPYLRFDFLLDD